MSIRDDILATLRADPTDKFVRDSLFDRVPHVFGGNRKAYIHWKSLLAQSLEVDSACLSFVGSSALGISLNPNKGFKSFDDESDVDVGVISHYHFTVSWRYLRTQGHRRLHLDAKTISAWDEHVTRLIYWGTIATDKLLGILPFGAQWLKALSHMATVSPTVGREINLRIYADYESLRAYQELSARKARDEILSLEAKHAEIS